MASAQTSANPWFSKLTKKAATSMHQLLRTSEDETKGMASMKWETFLKLMREMGFTYDPSTTDSSVRFDPPNPNDVSITFYKPHPDPTIHPVMLREFAKKLKKNYGWSEADFILAKPSKNETTGKSLKWDTFLTFMREKGFEYDPTTTGSSVRFDPPNPNDVSITFHKPHPDPTIHPAMLREFVKKLKKNYDWIETDALET